MNRRWIIKSLLLLLPGAIRGSSHLFMRVVGPVPAPVFLARLRVVPGLADLCAAAACLISFALIRRVGTTGTLKVTFLVPFLSLFWGAVQFRKPYNACMFLGLGVILLSVWLVMGGRERQQEKSPATFGNWGGITGRPSPPET